MNFTETQEKILSANESKVVVMSSAASGKTALLTEKVRRILQSGVDPRKVAVITFTNMAATELIQRLGADYKDGIFIGTIHALANYMLRAGGVDTSKVLNDEKFDELFELIVKNQHCIKHLDWVLLDEAQDSDPLQFNFLFGMIDPPNFFVTGDLKQTIYRWKGSEPELLATLAGRPYVTCYTMRENFRNGIKILEFAKGIIKPTSMIDYSIPVREELGVVDELIYAPDMIVNEIKKQPEYKKWAILCRTNAEISEISYFLKKNEIPVDTFKQGDLTKAELVERMAQNTVKVLTVHSAKGLEWDNVIVVGMRYFSEEERCIGYVAATRARNHLIWTRYAKRKR